MASAARRASRWAQFSGRAIAKEVKEPSSGCGAWADRGGAAGPGPSSARCRFFSSIRGTYRIYTWGREDGGRLGHGWASGAVYDQPVPLPVAGLPAVPGPPPLSASRASPRPPRLSVSCGFSHTLACINGALWAFGRGSGGRLGVGTEDGSEEGDRAEPICVEDVEGAVGVSAGGLHSAAVLEDGTAAVWGFNGFGALGLGQGVSALSGQRSHVSKRPKLLRGPWTLVSQTVARVVCGPAHTLVLSSGGLAFACGQAQGDGRLGVEAAAWTGQHSLPHLHQIVVRDPWKSPDGGDGPLVKFAALAAGHNHSVGLSTEGRVYTCGRNRDGQLGGGRVHGRHWMDPVTEGDLGDSRVVAVGAGASHSAAVTADGQLFTWGRGVEGQLGVLSPKGDVPRSCSRPARVAALEGEFVTDVACGQRTTMAVTRDGKLFAWGLNSGDMLGVDMGDKAVVALPVRVAPIGHVVQVSGGPAHAAAVVWEPE